MSTILRMNSTMNTSAIPLKYDIPSMQNTYHVNLDKGEDGWIIVTSPEIKSLITQGRDEEDAIKNALEVIDLLIEEKELDKDFKLVFYSRISG
ncbi:MAG: type II toxin-antitoxin system HicB family antitoxin [Nitrosopumilus sp.]|nr:type II toxin-antitoxin system HicB family antitoxin [Nitrosopumilus sp.]